MSKIINSFTGLLTRYLILILVAIPNLYLFYFILTPLTIYPVYFLFNLFFDTSLINNTILIVGKCPIELVNACIAGSAYYLLLILNLSIPRINIKERLTMISFSFSLLLIINLLRIFILGLMSSFSDLLLFDITHKLFWYLLSTIFVAGIWFLEVKLFRITEIPFYSDIKDLYNNSNIKR
jgi:exosortase/archaeosortase family protein